MAGTVIIKCSELAKDIVAEPEDADAGKPPLIKIEYTNVGNGQRQWEWQVIRRQNSTDRAGRLLWIPDRNLNFRFDLIPVADRELFPDVGATAGKMFRVCMRIRCPLVNAPQVVRLELALVGDETGKVKLVHIGVGDRVYLCSGFEQTGAAAFQPGKPQAVNASPALVTPEIVKLQSENVDGTWLSFNKPAPGSNKWHGQVGLLDSCMDADGTGLVNPCSAPMLGFGPMSEIEAGAAICKTDGSKKRLGSSAAGEYGVWFKRGFEGLRCLRMPWAELRVPCGRTEIYSRPVRFPSSFERPEYLVFFYAELVTREVIDVWNRKVALPLLNGLISAQAPDSVTAVAFLHGERAAKPRSSWRMRVLLWDSAPTSESVHVSAGRYIPLPGVLSLSEPVLEPWEEFAVGAELNGLLDRRGQHVEWRIIVRPYRIMSSTLWPKSLDLRGDIRELSFVDSAAPDGRGGFFLNGIEAPIQSVPGQIVRVGAIDLQFASFGDKPETTQQQDRDFTWHAQLTVDTTRSAAHQFDYPRVDFFTRLSLYDAYPGGQDRETLSTAVAQSESEAPLVLQIGSDRERISSSLDIHEVTGNARAHDIQIHWVRDSTAAQPTKKRKLVVLDRSPFFVGMVQAEIGTPLNAAESNELGIWENIDGRKGWQLGSREGIDLTLPPQGFGEAAIRAQYQPGYPYMMRVAGADGSGTPKYKYIPCDTRLTPPAHLQLRAIEENRRFGLPPWNLRKLFGQTGDKLPGPLVDRAEFELLYGLSTVISGGTLRLAEMESRVGSLVDPSTFKRTPQWLSATTRQNRLYREFLKQWSTLQNAALSRIGVLEFWDPGGTGTLKISDAIEFKLRLDEEGAAVGRNPHTLLPEYAPNEFNREVVCRCDPESSQHTQSELKHRITGKAQPERDELNPLLNKLPGGALWGVEQPGVFANAVSQQRAESGFLLAPKITAFGGFGYEEVLYDNGLTKIKFRVEQGNVSFYSVERKGRIGVFYNLSKHVVVYERTTAASKQFMCEQAQPIFDESGTPLLEVTLMDGVAMLRKVKEYIEIIEPKRVYPDSADSERRDCGFVRSSDFKQTIIPVSSRWSSTVQDGWVVPLWQAQEDPTVYPRPHIQVEQFNDPKSDQPTALRGIRNPNKIRFYTRTAPNSDADPRKWPRVAGIDCIDDVLPECDTGAGINSLAPDATLPDEQPMVSQAEEFTLELEPGSLPANITANRADQAITAYISNIVLTRGYVNTPSSAATGLKTVAGELQAKMAALRSELNSLVETIVADARTIADLERQLVGAGGTESVRLTQLIDDKSKEAIARVNLLQQEANGRKADLDALLAGAVTTLQNDLNLNVVNRERDRFIDRVNTNLERWKEQAKAEVENAKKPFLTALNELQSVWDAIKNGADRIEKFKSHALQRVDALEARLLANVRIPADELTRLYERFAQGIALGQAAVNDIKNRIDEFKKIFGELDLEIRNAKENVGLAGPKLDAFVNSRKQRFFDELERDRGLFASMSIELINRVDVLTRTLDDVIRQDCLGAARKLREDGDVAWTELENKARTAIGNWSAADVRTRVSQEIDSLSNKLQNKADEIANKFRDGGREIEGKIKTLTQESLKKIHDQVEALRTVVINNSHLAATNLQEFFNKSRDQLDLMVSGIKSKVDEIKTDVTNTATALQNKFDNAARTIAGQAQARVQEAVNSVHAQANAYKAKLQNAAAQIKEVIKAAEDSRAQLTNTLHGIEAGAKEAVDSLKAGLKGLPIAGDVTNAFTLYRAFGGTPCAPEMVFNRNQVAYYWNDLKNKASVLMTPCAALFDRSGDAIKSLGIRLPTAELAQKFLPRFEKLDLSTILPDFAGIKMQNLFSGIDMGRFKDNVEVTHGVDPQTRRAWAQILVKFFLGEREVFSLAILTLKVRNTRFYAKSQLEVREGGSVQRRMGRITADWDVCIGGMVLVTFKDAALEFTESGKIHFDISPERIEMPGIMKFVSDMLSKIAGSPDKDGGGSGFSIQLLKDELGIPKGMAAVLLLGPLDAQGATSGIANLKLGLRFMLELDLKKPSDLFALGVGFNLASKEKPFNIAAFILGGAGFVNVHAIYRPMSGNLSVCVDLGIYMSASLALAVGPLKGGVFLYLGINASFNKGMDCPGGTGLRISAVLILSGEVSVASIVTVSLVCVLELEYRVDNGGTFLLARGTVTLKIKICCFFTLKVSAGLEFRFKTGEGSSTRSFSDKESKMLV